MRAQGVVREWRADEGWGVLDLEGVDGGCCAHFSCAAMDGYVSFTAGDEVVAEFETPGQDGYAHRATRFWRAGTDPAPVEGPQRSVAYRSSLTIYWD